MCDVLVRGRLIADTVNEDAASRITLYSLAACKDGNRNIVSSEFSSPWCVSVRY